MSGAEIAVQEAVRAALLASPELRALTGIYDGPPPRAACPYASFSGGTAADWSTKTTRGREVRLAINLWDDGDTPARLAALAGAAEVAIEALPPALDAWRIASLVFTGSRTVRTAAGPWAALLEYRVRVVAA